MTRKKSLFVAAIAAFGITFTPLPAAADTSDTVKILGGLALLGIIAKTVDDRRDRRREAAARAQAERGIFGAPLNDRVLNGELRRIDGTQRSRNKGFKNARLPDHCLRIAETNRRDRLVYPRRCLNRNYKHAQKLPASCQRQLHTSRGVRTVYAAGCLRRDGWNVASR